MKEEFKKISELLEFINDVTLTLTLKKDSLNDVETSHTWSGSVVLIQEHLELNEPFSVTKL